MDMTPAPCWADPLTGAKRRKVAEFLARACRGFWDKAEPRLPDAYGARAFAFALAASAREMQELHLDVTESAEAAAR